VAAFGPEARKGDLVPARSGAGPNTDRYRHQPESAHRLIGYLRDAVSDRGGVVLVSEKLIIIGQQIGNTTVKTSQRQSTMTCNENPVN
jgi:hypothetical protein